MTLRDRLKGAAIAILLLVACLPAAVVITLVSSPIWSWLEARTGIEAYGHSGPAPWCYLLIYGLLIGICAFVWWRLERTKPAR